MSESTSYPTQKDLDHGYLRQFTKTEYLQEIEDYYNGKIPPVSTTDHTDPMWTKKFAHTLPPLEAYKLVPPRTELVCKSQAEEIRLHFYGWDNLTEFEKRMIDEVKKHITEVLKIEIPANFDDRDILKFVQA